MKAWTPTEIARGQEAGFTHENSGVQKAQTGAY